MKYDVMRSDSVVGIGARLETIDAESRESAEKTAREKHGNSVFVTLHTNAKPHRRRERPLDLGHMPRRKS